MTVKYVENHTGYGTTFGGETLLDRVLDSTGKEVKELYATELGGMVTSELNADELTTD